MRVLVTGANGYVGTYVVGALADAGHDVVQAVRRSGAATGPDGEIVAVGDIDGATDWGSALEGVDAVVHAAARVHVMQEDAADPLAAFREVNVAGTANLARQAAAAGVQQLVFLSSVSVHDPDAPQPLHEGSPVNPSTPYGRSKWEAEQALAHVDGAVTILRAPMVYGPDAPGNYERLVRLAERGLPLPFGATANARSMIHVENLAHCVVHVLERTDAAGTYLVCDADPISTTQLVQAIQASRGLSSRLVRVPKTLVTALGRITGRTAMVDKLWGDLVLDASRAHDDLGWTPPLTVTEALRRLD